MLTLTILHQFKKRKPRNVFKLKRLKNKRKELEKTEKRLSLEKIKRAINKEEWTIDDQNGLNTAVNETRAVMQLLMKLVQ